MIKVCSPSFSASPVLVRELMEAFPGSVSNKKLLGMQGHQILDYLDGVEAAIIGTEIIDKFIIDGLPRLKCISKYGVGVDSIDVEYAKSRGIQLYWQGGVNRRSVSEMTLCFLIGLFRNILFSSYKLKSGEWHKKGGVQLSGKTIGIVGCGFIGTDLLEFLQPFGCKILINDIIDKSDVVERYQKQGVEIKQVDLDFLLQESDAVSLHVPLTSETKEMVDADFLDRMKPEAFFINTSRGGVVAIDALKNALKNHTIAGAALDVFEIEPVVDEDLFGLANLALTPHIGGNAQEAVLAMGRSAIEGLKKFYNP